MKQNLIGAQSRGSLDEAGFQQLLAAAFVVQQHNDRLRLNRGTGLNYTKTLAEIVETEEQIKNGRLSLSSSLRLIVERARRLTNAEAAAVALLEDGYLMYRASSGRCADEVGSRSKVGTTVAAKCLRNGTVLQSRDTTNDKNNVDPELCWRKGVRSLLAAPITYENRTIGVLELRFANPNGFREEDVRTCELMAGMVILAVSVEWDAGRQKRLARQEDSAMTQALNKITPHLDRLLEEKDPDFASAGAALSGEIVREIPASVNVSKPAFRQEAAKAARPEPEPKPVKLIAEPARQEPVKSVPPTATNHPAEPLQETPATGRISEPVAAAPEGVVGAPPVGITTCQNCGREFVGDENLCGTCGVDRDAEAAAKPGQASTWASLWDLQQDAETADSVPGVSTTAVSDFALSNSPDAGENREEFLSNLQDIRERFTGQRKDEKRDPVVKQVSPEVEPVEEESPEPELSSFSSVLPEVSASDADNWTPVQRIKEFWDYHRATIYLAVAAILLLMVLLGWGEQPAPSAAASEPAQASANAAPELTMFEKMLVEMGLAEAPADAPMNPGNPEAKVWVDVHTGLYYCPSADLYGKTKGGKYEKQKDAQLDQFEPAARKACK